MVRDWLQVSYFHCCWQSWVVKRQVNAAPSTATNPRFVTRGLGFPAEEATRECPEREDTNSTQIARQKSRGIDARLFVLWGGALRRVSDRADLPNREALYLMDHGRFLLVRGKARREARQSGDEGGGPLGGKLASLHQSQPAIWVAAPTSQPPELAKTV